MKTNPVPAADPAGPGAARIQTVGAAAQSQGEDMFRRALSKRTLDLLAGVMDPNAGGIPGSGSEALRAASGADADAAALAAGELAAAEGQAGIRERGRDAASRASTELAQRGTRDDPRARETPAAPPPSRNAGDPPEQAIAALERAGGNHPKTRTDAARSMNAPVHGSETSRASRSIGVPGDPAANGSASTNIAATQRLAGVFAARGASQSAAAASPAGAARAPLAVQAGAAGQSGGGVYGLSRGSATEGRAPAPSPGPTGSRGAQEPEPAAQVQRGLAQVLRQKGGSLTLRLSPNELGEVRISLRVHSGRVDGVIEAEHEPARELLSRQIDGLRATLEQRGVTVDRLEVRLRDAAMEGARPAGSADADEPGKQAAGDAGRDRSGSEPRDGGDRSEQGGGGTPRRQDADTDDGASTGTIDGVPEHGRPREPAGGWIRLDTIV